MSGHTKEPWEFDGCTVYKTNEACNNNIFFTNVQGGFYQTYDVHTPRDELAANARRICLAVNACTGLSDESLETGVIGMLAKGARQILTASTAEQYDAAMKLLRDADELADPLTDKDPSHD